MHVCLPCACFGAQGGQKRVVDLLGKGVTEGCESLWVPGIELGSSEEHQVLLTADPFFQPQDVSLFVK